MDSSATTIAPRSRCARMSPSQRSTTRSTRSDRAGFEVTPFYHDGTLFHGPSFQGAEYVLNQSDQKVTMRCRLAPLSAEQQGQFPVQTLNPYIADVSLHSALIWMQKEVRQLVLPLSFQRAEHFKALEFGVPYYASLEIESATSARMIINLVVHDEQARIYLRILDLEGVVLQVRARSQEPGKPRIEDRGSRIEYRAPCTTLSPCHLVTLSPCHPLI